MERIRFAQLSFWFMHAHGICAAVQRHPHVDLACIWDDDQARGRAAAQLTHAHRIISTSTRSGAGTPMASSFPTQRTTGWGRSTT